MAIDQSQRCFDFCFLFLMDDLTLDNVTLILGAVGTTELMKAK
jgi:hypothetical protein